MGKVLISDVISRLEEWAPRSLQESYDNAGLIIGNVQEEVKGILVSLDVTETVVEEACKRGANLIVAHHPVIFSGLKSLTGKNYVERTVISAIRNGVAIYAIHTNLDNVPTGVNSIIADKLGLRNTQILLPRKDSLFKLVTFAPEKDAEKVRQAIFDAGGGVIGAYDSCSFNVSGSGTFRGDNSTNPYVGERGKLHTEPETRIEVVVPDTLLQKVIRKMLSAHPYEEVAYDVYRLENNHPGIGAGLIGELGEPVTTTNFLKHLKKTMKAGVVRYTKPVKERVSRIAVCGGSGSFLLGAAKAAGADVFVTGDFKYHEFFDAEDQIVIADIGHYESEQFTIDLIVSKLVEYFSTFAVLKTKTNTNPVNYL